MTPAPAARQIQCPSCGGNIAIKAAGYTVQVACQYCGSLLDVANPDVRLIEEYHQAAARLHLPLGSRGTLDNTEWEVIGYLRRSDDESEWSEYLLFNPYAGYRWLVHADGAWTFGVMLTELPSHDRWSSGVTFQGQSFATEYGAVETTTDYVLGEFYWRVRAGDRVQATTFTGYGGILSLEQNADEANWTQLTPVPGEVIDAAFAQAAMQRLMGSGPGGFGRKGVDPSAPAGMAAAAEAGETVHRAPPAWLSEDVHAAATGPLQDAMKMTIAGIGTLVLSLIIMALFGMTTDLAAISASVKPEAAEQTLTVGTITITRPYQAVSVTARATSPNFVNKWIDLDYSLVDRKTQKAINAYGLVEYYEGYDSDGHWTEGSRSTTTKFAGVPAGTYDLMVDVAAHNWNGGSSSSSYSSSSYGSSGSTGSAWGGDNVQVSITAARGGFFMSNQMMWLILLLVPPGFMIWRAVKRAQGGYDDD